MPIPQRLLNFTFQLSADRGSFKEGGNTLKLSGLRATAKLVKAGGPAMGEAQLSIYGMTLSQINQLATLGLRVQQYNANSVTVEAGNEGGAMATVFVGTVTAAWAAFEGSPDVPFQVLGQAMAVNAMISAQPTSTKGSADAATIMAGLAGKAGLAFENSGVQTQVPPLCLEGTLREQMLALTKMAHIHWNSGENGIVAIWPWGKARGGEIPLVSPDTGLIGYPSYTAEGILLKTVFNPAIGFGGKIRVRSQLEPASKTWAVIGLSHDLASKMPRGNWETTIVAYNSDYAAPTPLAPTS